MNLGDVFASVAWKRLAGVDLPDRGSNQHELNGTSSLKDFFQTGDLIRGEVEWYALSDDRETEREQGTFTFYDARARSNARTQRSEWRLYYSGSFLERAKEGDLLVLARDHRGKTHAILAQADSGWFRALHVLFDIQRQESQRFRVQDTATLQREEIEFLRKRIIDELELADFRATEVIPSDNDLISMHFSSGGTLMFPTTAEMSRLARSLTTVDPIGDPDGALIGWLQREEQLFRALEQRVLDERLANRFTSTEDFLSFSLSVQNRRKSRAGHALENHLAALFSANSLEYERGIRTEGNNRPDFVFPSEHAYHDRSIDDSCLLMLGAKTTCKDRWRQVLTEADRVHKKHLCTLEISISANQTTEMGSHGLTLVIPAALHRTYSESQQQRITSVADFISLAADVQRGRQW